MLLFVAVFWEIMPTFVGVFTAAFIALKLERRKARRERERLTTSLRQVLVEGLQRNIVTLRRMRCFAAGENGEPPACPSQSLQCGHFDATIVSSVELLEADPDQYGTLLNASHVADHINRRVEVLAELERMTFTGQGAPPRADLHYAELVRQIDGGLPMFEGVLRYLGGDLPPEPNK